MQKVLVIGCPGSGKSTFARRLAELTGLPLIHIDMLYWTPEATEVEGEVFRARLQAVLSEEKWIIDGNYASTLELRLEACDTVFFLDYPVEVCLAGIAARWGQVRPDLPWVELAEGDPEFISFVESFPLKGRPRLLELLDRFSDRDIHVFRSRAEADMYLGQH